MRWTEPIQNESTNALFIYTFLALVIALLVVKWIRHNKKNAESSGEYYIDFLTDFRLYGVIAILIIGICATLKELLERF